MKEEIFFSPSGIWTMVPQTQKPVCYQWATLTKQQWRVVVSIGLWRWKATLLHFLLTLFEQRYIFGQRYLLSALLKSAQNECALRYWASMQLKMNRRKHTPLYKKTKNNPNLIQWRLLESRKLVLTSHVSFTLKCLKKFESVLRFAKTNCHNYIA